MQIKLIQKFVYVNNVWYDNDNACRKALAAYEFVKMEFNPHNDYETAGLALVQNDNFQ